MKPCIVVITLAVDDLDKSLSFYHDGLGLKTVDIIGNEKKATPPEKASEWLPLVHIVIGNMKTFINGTFHGVSSVHLQEYLNEFCYRFNRRFWEPELPLRLLNACLAHVPVRQAEFD